jgi:hypothetical protein
MIDFAVINPALVELFANLADMQVNYTDKQREFTDPVQQARILLRWRQSESIGTDERRVEHIPVGVPDPPIVMKSVGNRRVGLDVRIESFRHDDDKFAFNRVEKIRTGLQFLSSLYLLRELNISIIRKSQTLDISNVLTDQHVTSVAVLDLILNIGASADDPQRLQTIETVNVSYQGPVT